MESHLDIRAGHLSDKTVAEDWGLRVAQEEEYAYYQGHRDGFSADSSRSSSRQCPYFHGDPNAVAWAIGYHEAGSQLEDIHFKGDISILDAQNFLHMVRQRIENGPHPAHVVSDYNEQTKPTKWEEEARAAVANEESFKKGLAKLINAHGYDTALNLSDDDVATMIRGFLQAVRNAVNPPKFGADQSPYQQKDACPDGGLGAVNLERDPDNPTLLLPKQRPTPRHSIRIPEGWEQDPDHSERIRRVQD